MKGNLQLDPLLLEEFALDPWALLVTTGSATATLSKTVGFTLAATAADPLAATVGATIAVPTLAATATVPDRAQLSQTVGVTAAAAATAIEKATLAATLAVPSISASATAVDNAAVSQTVGITLTAAGTVVDNAALAAAVPAFTLAAVAHVPTGDLALAQSVGLSLAATAQVPTADLSLAGSVGLALAAVGTVVDDAQLDGSVGLTLAATLAAGDIALAELAGTVGISATAVASVVASAALDGSVGVTLAAASTSATHAALAGTIDVALAATAGVVLQAQATAAVDVGIAALARAQVHAAVTAVVGVPAISAQATVLTAAVEGTVDGTDVLRPNTQHHPLRPAGGVHDVPRPRTTISAARRTVAPTLSARPHAEQVLVDRAGETQMCIFRKSKPRVPKPLPARYALVSRTLDSFTLASQATVVSGPGALSASLEATIGGVTLASAATRTAAKAASLAGVVGFGLDASAGLPAARTAALAGTLELPVLVAIGAVSSPRTASLDRPLPGFALLAAAHVGALPSARSAALSATVGQLSLEALASSPQPLYASLSGAVSLAMSASARHARQAQVSTTAPTFTLSAAGHVKHTANLARTAPVFTLAATSTTGGAGAPVPARLRGSTAVSVKSYGALGNGVHNDTAAFNSAIAALPSDGGTVTVPAGTYMIDPVVSVKLRSRMHLLLDPAATLKAITNTNPRCYVLTARLLNNVEISGGTIIGDLDTFVPQTGTTSEWKHNIACYGSTSVTVHDIHLTKAPGDGISVGGASSTSSADVLLYNVRSDYNRRQGLSIVGVNGMTVRDSQFNYTKGTSPECGIDIEPEATAPSLNILIQRCELAGNNKYGLNLLRRSDGNDVDTVRVEDCDVHHNVSNGLVTYGGSNVVVTGGEIRLNGATGLFTTGTTNMDVSYVTFTSNYTRNGITTRTAFDLVGTSSPKTDKDILLRNLSGTTSTAGRVIGLNHYT